MPYVVCGRRKSSKTCLKDPDVCKCNDASKSCYTYVAVPKAVRCASRKEKGCKLAPDTCAWDANESKCHDVGKNKRNSVNKELKKTEDPVKTKVTCSEKGSDSRV